MSVIAIAYTSDGFVIGADGRCGYSTGDAKKDEEQKIFEAYYRDNPIAYALTGTVALLDDNLVTYSKKIVEALASEPYAGSCKYVDSFGRYLRQKIANAIAKRGHVPFSSDADEELMNGYIVTELTVIGYFHGKAFIRTAYVTHRNNEINPECEFEERTPRIGQPYLPHRPKGLEVNPSHSSSLEGARKFIEKYIEECKVFAAQRPELNIGGWTHIAEVKPHKFDWKIEPKKCEHRNAALT